jgi:hypothetical protein
MRRHPFWIAGITLFLLALSVLVVLHFRNGDSGGEINEYLIMRDSGGGSIELSAGGPGCSFFLVCVCPDARETSHVDGLELNPLGLMPIRTFLFTTKKDGLEIPSYRDKPTLVLIDETGEVLFDRCPISKSEMRELMTVIRSTKSYAAYFPNRRSEDGSIDFPEVPPPPVPPDSVIAALLDYMQKSKKPWPEPVVKAMEAYVAKTNSQTAPESSTAGRP